MTKIVLDASPGKKPKGVPADQEGRKAYYEKIIGLYAGQNPVKFQAKQAELEKKRDGFEYIAGKWVNIFDAKTLKDEIKLTNSEKEQAAEQDNVRKVAELGARNAELEAQLKALESNKVEKPKVSKTKKVN